ncbi:MAG: regulatory protein GemA [Desulfobulbaceae bacterium]
MPTHAEYAKINIACKELGIDKYALLADRYKLESSKQLSRRQVFDLLEHLRAMGFRARRKKTSSPRYDDAQMRKVVALWITLHKAGAVRSGADQALQKYVKRMTGADNLKWCGPRELSKLIEGLKSWCQRVGVEIE